MNPIGKALLIATVLIGVSGIGVFSYFYVKFGRMIDEKLFDRAIP